MTLAVHGKTPKSSSVPPALLFKFSCMLEQGVPPLHFVLDTDHIADLPCHDSELPHLGQQGLPD